MKTAKRVPLALAEIFMKTRKIAEGITFDEYVKVLCGLTTHFSSDAKGNAISLTGLSLLHRLSALLIHNSVKNTVKYLEGQHMILCGDVFIPGVSATKGSGGSGPGCRPIHVMPLVEFGHEGICVPANIHPPVTYGKLIPSELRPTLANATLKGAAILSSLWGFFFGVKNPTADGFVHAFAPLSRKPVLFKSTAECGPNFISLKAIEGWNVFMDAMDEELESYLHENQTANSPGANLSYAEQIVVHVCITSFSITVDAFKAEVSDFRLGNAFSPTEAKLIVENAYKVFVESVIDMSDDIVAPVFELRDMKPVPSVAPLSEDVARVPMPITAETTGSTGQNKDAAKPNCPVPTEDHSASEKGTPSFPEAHPTSQTRPGVDNSLAASEPVAKKVSFLDALKGSARLPQNKGADSGRSLLRPILRREVPLQMNVKTSSDDGNEGDVEDTPQAQPSATAKSALSKVVGKKKNRVRAMGAAPVASDDDDSSSELNMNSPDILNLVRQITKQPESKRRKIIEELIEKTGINIDVSQVNKAEGSGSTNGTVKDITPPQPARSSLTTQVCAPTSRPSSASQAEEARASRPRVPLDQLPSRDCADAAKPFPPHPHNQPPQGAPGPSTSPALLPQMDVEDLERDKMNRAIERREENRQRNASMPLTRLRKQYCRDIRAMRNIMIGAPVRCPRFELDDPDSENEDEVDFRESYAEVGSTTRGRSKPSKEETLRVDLELFYAVLLALNIDPKFFSLDPGDESLVCDLSPEKNKWLEQFLHKNIDLFRYEVTRAEDSDAYADHQKMMLYLESFFQVQHALLKEFPDLHNYSSAVARSLFESKRDFYHLRVEQSDLTRQLCNITCVSSGVDSNVRRSMLQKFTGMTVCVGMFQDPSGKKPQSRAMLFFCRSLSHSGLMVEDPFGESHLSDVKLRLAVHRLYADEWKPSGGSLLKLWPICSLVTQQRMFRAAHNTYRLPTPLQERFWGKTFDNERTLSVRKMPSSLAHFKRIMPSHDELRSSVDPGCLDYLDNLQQSQCDSSQLHAVLTSLAEQSGNSRGSTSLSLTVGPPGTGKSSTIAVLVGALMHHSKIGHVGHKFKKSSRLRGNEGQVTFSNNPDGLRILITCSSNHGVDEMTRKLRDCIPDANGGHMNLKMARVGRHNYDYKELVDFSVQNLALQYEHQLFSPQQEPPRLFPSRKAKLALMDECVVVLCTSSTAGGPMLQNLKFKFGMTIIDEAAHASELDAMTAIVSNAIYNQHGRLHVVLVGDHNQLSPVHVSQHSTITFLNVNRGFRFPYRMTKQYESLFFRMFHRNLAPYSMLQNQYRCHPYMGSIQSRFMYGDIVRHPGNPISYDKPFNTCDRPLYLRPLTVIDTVDNSGRFERRAKNGFINLMEAEAVNDLLYKLQDTCSYDDLKDNVIISAPYRHQVEFLSYALKYTGNFLSTSPNNQLNIMIDTVDALQGTERSIVIISLTRSNPGAVIGFLKNNNRLNVATSRAKHLLVLVGDSSTFCKNRLLNSMYSAVESEVNGTSLVFWGGRITDRFSHIQSRFLSN